MNLRIYANQLSKVEKWGKELEGIIILEMEILSLLKLVLRYRLELFGTELIYFHFRF